VTALVLSSNEIDAMATKAAKGVGMPWGLASDAGRAARWLADHGLPGPEVLADLLEWRDGRPHTEVAPPDVGLSWVDHPTVLDPVVVGAVCADLPERLVAGRAELGRIRQPLLLGAALASVAIRTRTALVASWGDATLGVGVGGATGCGSLGVVEAAVTVEPGRLDGEQLTAPVDGWPVDPAAWARLEAYAHRTYAPDTEASRLRGAGAGLIDD